MSVISNASLRVSLSATSTTERAGVSGSQSVGTSIVQRLADASIAWGALLTFNGASATATAALDDGLIAATTTPVRQVETATVVAASGCTSDGTCDVVVTGANIAGSPVTVPVALTTVTHTSAALIAGAIRTAIAANAAITAATGYTVGGSSATASLTDKVDRDNDATLNIAIPAGLGITAAASSANTTAGVGGVAVSGGGDGKDDDGLTLPVATALQALVINNTGTAAVWVSVGIGLAGLVKIEAGSFQVLGVTTGDSVSLPWLEDAFTITSDGPTTVEITAFAD